MRIAVYQNLPPGGALRLMREVVARLSGQHEFVEFSPKYEERDWALRPLTNALSVAREERRIAREIDAGGFDVVLVNGCRVMQAPGLLSRLTTPSVYLVAEPRRRSVEPGYRPGSKERSGLAGLVWAPGRALYDKVLGRRDRRSVADATALASISQFTAANVARIYGRDSTICRPGIDTEQFRPRPDGASSRAHYLSVGALDPSKGHDLAIEAVSRLENDARLPLVVVGSRTDDVASDALRDLADTRGVELTLRTSVTEADLLDLYRDAAATLCMAHLEPFGLTVNESVASGTPVVAVREGGYCETVVEKVNGVTVGRDATEIANAISHVGSLGLADHPWRLHEAALPWQWDATVATLQGVLQSVAR